MKEPAQHQLNCEIERCTEKLANIEDRLIQLEGKGSNSWSLASSIYPIHFWHVNYYIENCNFANVRVLINKFQERRTS